MTPLELWDLIVDGQPLCQTAPPRLPQQLARGVVALRRGEACCESTGSLAALDFDLVLLAGGAAGEEHVAALAAAGVVVERDPRGRIGPALGGVLLGADLVADVGQTAIKLAWRGGTHTLERDLSALPVGGTDARRGRSELRGWLAAGLRAAPVREARLIVALPAEIAEDGVPGGSSYAGMLGDRDLVADAVALAGTAPFDVRVLNDAELAAASLRERAAGRRALVLTLGHGVGAALLRAG